jgi:hypothetical protein
MHRVEAKRAWVSAVLAFVFLVLLPSPAHAHTGDHIEATDYETVISEFSPPDPAIGLRTVAMGDRLELANPTDAEVTIFGYEDEPYARVSSGGTFVNERSPAYWLNQSFDEDRQLPPEADATAPPKWIELSSSSTFAWHDHRAHWMESTIPEAVAEDPDSQHVIIDDWQVSMALEGQEFVARGDVVYEPGPSVVPWAILGIVVALAIALLAWRYPSGRFLMAATTLTVAMYAVDVVGTRLLPTGVGGVTAFTNGIDAAIPVAIAVVLAGTGIFAMLTNRGDGRWLCLFAAMVIALVGGAASVGSIGASQVPSVLPADLYRGLVTAMLAMGVGISLPLGIRLLRIRTSERAKATEAS